MTNSPGRVMVLVQETQIPGARPRLSSEASSFRQRALSRRGGANSSSSVLTRLWPETPPGD
jgi:hypothetical protein